MKESFKHRLDQLLPRLTSRELLTNAGLGNEIGFYIFDYPPEKELEVREHTRFLLKHIKKTRPDIYVEHINLFELIIGYLEKRSLLDRAIKMQKEKGNDTVLKALKAPLDPGKIARHLVEKIDTQKCDLLLLSGVGNAWPLMRSHNLLNNLHSLMDNVPLVMFYPGEYTGQGLRLFKKLGETNYYRAFQLVP